ncbi:MAG: hypothetical protein HQ579_08150, partial [Candidatus Omnitrophica bacterium]|nr:hypothetical protein [Candidatus Omnitrophota bacterium]
KIAEKYSLKRQRERVRKIDYEEIYRKTGRNNAPDEHFLLKKNTITSGKIREWKNALNWFQLSIVEGLAYDWIVQNKYPITQKKISRLFASFVYSVFIRPVGKSYSFAKRMLKKLKRLCVFCFFRVRDLYKKKKLSHSLCKLIKFIKVFINPYDIIKNEKKERNSNDDIYPLR